jgi:ferredoxin
VDKFCNWYLDRLGAELEPAARSSPTISAPAAKPSGNGSAARAAPVAPAASTDARLFSVSFNQSGHSVPCRADQTILTAAEAAGLPLPFSCREGRCGTCRARLLSGEVDMKHAGGIRARQIDQGDILVCCSRPLSDLVIEK